MACLLAGLGGTFALAGDPPKDEASDGLSALPKQVRGLGRDKQCVHTRRLGDNFGQFFFRGDASDFNRVFQQCAGVSGAVRLSVHTNPKSVPCVAPPGKPSDFSYDWMVTARVAKSPHPCLFLRFDVWLNDRIARDGLKLGPFVPLNDVARLRTLILTTEVPIPELVCWQGLSGLAPHGNVPLLMKCYDGSTPAKEGVPFRKWYWQCYEDLSAVKPGMTRREIGNRVWGDGGLSMDTCECEDFVHPACPALKIRIEFAVKHDDQNLPVRSQDDIVVDVSVPFVEEFFCD
ncbi:MAG: hypothetical protein JXB62_09095 [Pirellulales bacterium]|nr:hypothetical protein [Pirellulales bacterium]